MGEQLEIRKIHSSGESKIHFNIQVVKGSGLQEMLDVRSDRRGDGFVKNCLRSNLCKTLLVGKGEMRLEGPERKGWFQISAIPFRSIPSRKPGMNFRRFRRRSLGEESKAKDFR